MRSANAVAGGGGDHVDLLEIGPLVELGDQGQQLLLPDQIDLVEDQDFRLRPVLQPVEQVGDAALEAGAGVDHQSDQIGVLRAAPGGGDHRPVEAALGLENARRVGEQDLGLAVDGDAHQPGAGGLRLGGDDRDLLPDQGVDQGGLAGIGRADDGDGAEALRHVSLLQQRLRGLGFGLLLGEAFRLGLADALDRDADREGGAWCGPERQTSS